MALFGELQAGLRHRQATHRAGRRTSIVAAATRPVLDAFLRTDCRTTLLLHFRSRTPRTNAACPVCRPVVAANPEAVARCVVPGNLRRRTTSLSATLLELAVGGNVVEPLQTLMDLDRSRDEWRPALSRRSLWHIRRVEHGCWDVRTWGLQLRDIREGVNRVGGPLPFVPPRRSPTVLAVRRSP
jgi:hypothetical protein